MKNFIRLLPLLFAAAALAGCETTGSAVAPTATAASPAPPMTHTRAAEICWMATEHGHNDMDLDKRADVVDKCIEEKMKGTGAASKS
ncbi:MAG TPA: hypothetical protein VFS63_07900 [Pseudolabrys sp.]|jgi:hypothetical protein|nr:hypothetical protein [Pseudolabrys sp.]